MPEYSGGTVWLQVAPSFLGVQESIRREVSGAMKGVDNDVQRSADRITKTMGEAGKKSGKDFSNSFEATSRKALKRFTKDLEAISRTGVKDEVKGWRTELERIGKLDLSKVTNQDQFLRTTQRIRGEIQNVIDAADKGQIRIQRQTRTTLGALREPLDTIQTAMDRWNRADPERLKSLEAQRRQYETISRAQKEMAGEFEKRSKAEQDALNAQIAAWAKWQDEQRRGIEAVEALKKKNHEAEQRRMQSDLAQQSKAQRENVEIDFKLNSSRIRSEMRRIQDEIKTLGADLELDADVDVAEAMARIGVLRSALAALEADAIEVDVDVNTTQAMIQLRMLEARANSTKGQVTLMGRALRALDAGQAANSVRVFNGRLFTILALGPALIPVLAGIGAGIFGIGAAAVGAVAGIGILLTSFAGIGNALSAMNELDRQQRLASAGGGSQGARDALASQQRAVDEARAVADAQRTLARVRRDAARGIADADARIIDAEEALILAQERATESAEDAARRVTDAQRRLSDARRDAAESAERAAEAVVTAELRLTEAQESAAEAQRDLNEARQQAVRDLEDLNNQLDSARLKERGLEFSVEEAAVHLNVVLEDDQATQREKDKAQLAYDEVVESLEQQRLETGRLEKDTKKANAAGVEGSDRVKDAKERIKEANEGIVDAEADLANAREAQTRAAEDGQRQIADAQLSVRDAIDEQADAAVDAARNIDDAETDLADARADRALAAEDAAESIADAQRALSRVYEDQRFAAAEAALGIGATATAVDGLKEALLGMNPAAIAFATWLYSLKPLWHDIRDAVQEGFLPGLQEGLSTIIDKYGPSFVTFVGEMATVAGNLARAFGDMLVSPQWESFFEQMADVSPIFLQQFGEFTLNLLTGFMELFRAFLPFMVDMGDWLVGVSDSFKNWAAGLEGSEAFESFIDYLRESMPLMSELLGNLGEIFVNLLIGLAPYADDLVESLIGFTDWLAEMEPDELARLALTIGAIALAVQALAGAMALISGVGGLFGGVLKLFGAGKPKDAAGAVGAAGGGKKKAGLGKRLGLAGLLGIGAAGTAEALGADEGGVAAAGAGGGLLGMLGLGGGGLTKFRAVMSEAGEAIKGVGTKSGGAKIAVKFLGKGLLAFLGPVGIAIGVIWLLVDAFVWLYENVEGFRTFVDEAWAAIVGTFQGAQEETAPIFQALGEMWSWLRTEIIDPFVTWLTGIFVDNIQPAFENLYNKGVKPSMDFIGGLFEVLGEVVNRIAHAITEIFEHIIAPGFQWLYDTAIRPVMENIVDVISDAWRNDIKPVFEAFGDFIEEHVAPAFETAVGAIGNVWAGLIELLRTPARFVVETIINDGLIAGFNWLAKRTGMDEMEPIKVPDALQPGGRNPYKRANDKRHISRALGGVLPGYTPGRDVHRFVSDTAGTLDLSGGEGIARPEIVQAIGTGRWNAANRAARQGKVSDALGYLGGFKNGGVIGDLIDHAKGAVGRVGDVAGAVSNPIKWLKEIVKDLIPDSMTKLPRDIVASTGAKAASGVGDYIKEKLGSLIGIGGGGSSSPGGPLGKGKVHGVSAMTAALRALDPSAQVTSGYRGGAFTSTGYPSFHGLGRAIDIVSPNMGKTWEILRNAFGGSAKELFYSPKGFLRNGVMGGAAAITRQQHFSHVHWAMNKGGIVPKLYDQGGDVPPGLTLVANKTQKPESIVTNQFMESVKNSRGRGDGPLVDARGSHFGATAEEIAVELNRARRDKLALAGLDFNGGL